MYQSGGKRRGVERADDVFRGRLGDDGAVDVELHAGNLAKVRAAAIVGLLLLSVAENMAAMKKAKTISYTPPQ